MAEVELEVLSFHEPQAQQQQWRLSCMVRCVKSMTFLVSDIHEHRYLRYYFMDTPSLSHYSHKNFIIFFIYLFFNSWLCGCLASFMWTLVIRRVVEPSLFDCLPRYDNLHPFGPSHFRCAFCLQKKSWWVTICERV